MNETQYYKYEDILELDSGYKLEKLQIAYHTFGKLSQSKDNVIWVCHALTANSNIEDWWSEAIGKDRFLDTDKYFIVCANILGSHYGTTSPLSINPQTNRPYYDEFPKITIRDMVKCHQILADALGIKEVELLVGASIGGFQVIEWLIINPSFAKRAALIATTASVSPWVVAFNESQRMAIENDKTFGQKNDKAALEGMATARSIALLSYRSAYIYNKTQLKDISNPFEHRASTYQRYQGNKLSNRFNAYSYHILTHAIDSHDISRSRDKLEIVLSSIKAKCSLIAITSDLLFTVEEHYFMRKNIKNSYLYICDSDYGHDGFLMENKKIEKVIKKLLNDE